MALQKCMAVIFGLLYIVIVPLASAEAHGKKKQRRGTVVEASGATSAARRGTRVKVRAPHSKVDVNTKARRVRIRVPYFNGDIRW